MTTFRTQILEFESVALDRLTYVVIGAREGHHWIFVRHHLRETWEMPAGHIEKGENAEQAAVRELYEESGTIASSLVGICDYSVIEKGRTGYGRLFGARVHQRESLPDLEIAEISLVKDLPLDLTYPEVQRVLFKQVKQQLR